MTGGTLGEVEDELESIVYVSQLVTRQMADPLAEGAGVDGADHLAHHASLPLVDRYLWMEACFQCRRRGGADDNGGQREQIVGLDDDGQAASLLDVAPTSRERDLVNVTADHEAVP